jgi:hypothetical protein
VCPIRFGFVVTGGPIELEQMGSADPPLAVIVDMVAVAQKKYTVWVGLVALLPLALLLFTGLYLFVLPYATKWRSGRRTD